MNNVTLIGRLTKDPEIRYTEQQLAVVRFNIAIDRIGKDKGADFPSIVVFGKQAENCEKWLHKGRLVAIQGHIQTGNYTNKDGNKVYTTDVVVEEQEFAESKAVSDSHTAHNSSMGAGFGAPSQAAPAPNAASADGFMNIPDGIDEELPFS